MTADRARRAASFGRAAEAYARGRPGYPHAALDWLLPAGARRVLDLGAGTGKLTRQLAGRRLDVVAVDPSERMLDQLRAALPDVEARVRTAEALPLSDASVDVALVAQAWHWVDPRRAVPEVARVRRPGGRLGLLWNVRDERVPWVAELWEPVRRGDALDSTDPEPFVGKPFSALERRDVEWEHATTPDAVLDLVASRSHVITLPESRRAGLLEDVRAVLARHFPDGGRVRFPYVARCFRADRAL